jgi:nucleolar GTP-binding protein
MNLTIGKIEQAQTYLDKAFKNGRLALQKYKIDNPKATKVNKYMILEIHRISTIKESLVTDLDRILKAMPMFDELDEFYKRLFMLIIDVDNYKKYLGSVLWAKNRIEALYEETKIVIKGAKKFEEIVAKRNAFIARCDSFLKQINESFTFIDEARYKLKSVPNIKTSLFTFAIAGFPNVGKSTLLGKLTGSKPDVQSYAFTTKGLMIGYIKEGEDKIQIVDTPGTLNRFEKMNNIEQVASLCLEYIADAIIYIFDLSEPYPIDDQIALYNNLKRLGKPIFIYFSKNDILDKKKFDAFKIKGIYSPEDLKAEILKHHSMNRKIAPDEESDDAEEVYSDEEEYKDD